MDSEPRGGIIAGQRIGIAAAGSDTAAVLKQIKRAEDLGIPASHERNLQFTAQVARDLQRSGK